MKQPTEQQLKDPKWWDENAPEGSNYYAYGSIEPFEKFDGHGWFWFDRDVDTWFEMSFKTMADREQDSGMMLYKRPKHHAQWKGPQDGLPPVGFECEGIRQGGEPYEKGSIQYISDQFMIWRFSSTKEELALRPGSMIFRPIQSRRKKTIKKAWEIFKPHADSVTTVMEGLNELHDAGMLVDPERKPMSRAEAFEALYIEIAFSHERINEILDLLGYKD